MLGTIAIYSLMLTFSVCAARNASKSKKYTNLHLFFLILVLSLVSGLRSKEVGVDSQGYANIYLLNGDVKYIEVGFRWLIKFLHIFSDSYTFFFSVLAVATNTLIIMRLWELRHVARFNYSVLVYSAQMFFFTMSGVRQWLAVSIAFWATRYIDKGKLVRYVLIVLVAMTIHTSAMVSLVLLAPLMFKKQGRWGTLFKMATVIVMPLVIIVGYRLYSENYAHFLATSKSDFGFMVPLRMALFLPFIVLCLWRREKDKVPNVGFNMTSIETVTFYQMLAIVAAFSGYFFDNVARVGWYFEIFTPIYYGYILNQRPHRALDVRTMLKIIVMVIILYTFHL